MLVGLTPVQRSPGPALTFAGHYSCLRGNVSNQQTDCSSYPATKTMTRHVLRHIPSMMLLKATGRIEIRQVTGWGTCASSQVVKSSTEMSHESTLLQNELRQRSSNDSHGEAARSPVARFIRFVNSWHRQ
jgi:hypothetical protein